MASRLAIHRAEAVDGIAVARQSRRRSSSRSGALSRGLLHRRPVDSPPAARRLPSTIRRPARSSASCRSSDAPKRAQAIDAAAAALPGWRARTGKGACGDPPPLVRPDHGQPGRPRHADDARAGKAARRVAQRGRLRRRVHRVVRRRSQAHLRRHDSVARPRQAHRRRQGTDRRRRLHHAVELSHRDDHPQGRTGARRRLHGGRRSRPRRRRSPRWRSPCSPSAPACPTASSTSSPDRPPRSAAS